MSRRRQATPPRSGSSGADSSGVIRIKPYQYIHVQDNNANVTKVVTGPCTYTTQQHEKVTVQPSDMIIVPPRHYCIIKNPVVMGGDGKPATNKAGQVLIRLGDSEVREHRAPFPLYPGESLVDEVMALKVVPPMCALRLLCIIDFEDEVAGVTRNAGDEYLFKGPATYVPRVQEKMQQVVKAEVVARGNALKLRARKACVDDEGVKRKAGEEWLWHTAGAYLPGVDIEVVQQLSPYVLTDDKALHLKAVRNFKTPGGTERKAGEEWLITRDEHATYIPDVYEEVVNDNVRSVTLSNTQYAVILDPIGANGRPQLGQRVIKLGPATFFLQPGEKFEDGVKDAERLAENEALLLKATEAVTDSVGDHKPGDYWMVYGPRSYVPPVQVEIVQRRSTMALDDSEGIYVRDWATGKIRVESGVSYMLKPNEELWAKDLPRDTERLLAKEQVGAAAGAARVKHRVVTFRAKHNTAVQIYDYKEKRSRVEFGPQLIMLGPDEQITMWSLSGDQPKKAGVVKTLSLRLGPEFTTDQFTVETSDHAKLSLRVAYNWYFDVDKTDPANAIIFNVPDFVGDMCKAVAGRVRGVVAATTFDTFHKFSSSIIRNAVFGPEETELRFPANGLVITKIDIQSVEPVDQRTRDSLVKSVQLAIKITTDAQQAKAKHDAQQIEQNARGNLERQQLKDDATAERLKQELIRLQTLTKTVEQTGEATADAEANAKAREIEGTTDVLRVELEAKAKKISTAAELEHIRAQQEAEIEHAKAMDQLELDRQAALASIESARFKVMVETISPDTIAAISKSGPETEARILKALGLKSLLITDGKSPVNLFSTARGLVKGDGFATAAANGGTLTQ